MTLCALAGPQIGIVRDRKFHNGEPQTVKTVGFHCDQTLKSLRKLRNLSWASYA